MGIMVAFESFEIAKIYFDELVSRYSSFVNNNGSPTIDTNTKSNNSSPSSNSPGSQISPVKNTNNDSSIIIDSQTHPIVEPPPNNNLKNVPSVGILRAQQYESIASNMHMFNSPDARKCSISFDNRDLSRDNSQSQSYDDEAINILNIFIRDYETKSDDESEANLIHEFVTSKRDLLRSKKIRRVTFSVASKRQQPSYFTFRARDDYKEDKIYRHLEPALAFQLEIYRLRTFALELIPTSNLKIHLYLGKAKVAKGVEVTDYRFFARCIIRHSDLITKEASYEYLQSEAERTLLEALNELECSFSHPLASKTDCNHIYMCFVPCVCIDPAKVEESVRSMVLR
jgi:hypothetical protein